MPTTQPVQTKSGRFYTWGKERYPSVTNVLDVLNKPALPAWAARLAATFVVEHFDTVSSLMLAGEERATVDLIKGAPWRNRDKAASLGTMVHEMVEANLAGVAPMLAAGTERHAIHFQHWLEAFQPEILLSEVTIYNREHRYAGTLDLVIRYEGEDWCVDVKSGSGVYPEHAMQVAAYSRGEFVGRADGTEDPMPEVTQGAVLHLRPDSVRFIPVEISAPVFQSFLDCLRLFWWQEELAPTVIGGEIRRG